MILSGAQLCGIACMYSPNTACTWGVLTSFVTNWPWILETGKGLKKGPETILKVSKMFQAFFSGLFPDTGSKIKQKSARNQERPGWVFFILDPVSGKRPEEKAWNIFETFKIVSGPFFRPLPVSRIQGQLVTNEVRTPQVQAVFGEYMQAIPHNWAPDKIIQRHLG